MTRSDTAQAFFEAFKTGRGWKACQTWFDAEAPVAWDEARQTAVATAEFHGPQTGDGGLVPPTGKAVVSDYANVIRFEGNTIAHMTKTSNNVHAQRELGWS